MLKQIERSFSVIMNLNGKPIIFAFSLKRLLDMSRITCLIVLSIFPSASSSSFSVTHPMILEQMHVIYTLKKKQKKIVLQIQSLISLCMYTIMADKIPFSNRIGISKTKPGRFDTDYQDPRNLNSHILNSDQHHKMYQFLEVVQGSLCLAESRRD